mmetsp:Transcript_140083/g.314592  ORF Transcript_140083/g.314592 Transcript_140083/m.314592 type:complete len:112 (+) Transcript_140083:1443-1778(+)
MPLHRPSEASPPLLSSTPHYDEVEWMFSGHYHEQNPILAILHSRGPVTNARARLAELVQSAESHEFFKQVHESIRKIRRRGKRVRPRGETEITRKGTAGEVELRSPTSSSA